MESIIQLKKNGFYLLGYNENLGTPQMYEINQPIWSYYNHELVVDEDITYGDIFANLEPYLDKLEEHFLADRRGWDVKEWFEEIKKEKTSEKEEFSEIQITWDISASPHYFDGETSKYDYSLDRNLCLFAVVDPAKSNHSEEMYRTWFIDIQNLRDVPVVINYRCKINMWNIETKKNDILLEYDDGFSLREFIACLFQEITFYGSPKNTKGEFEKIKKAIEEGNETEWATTEAKMRSNIPMKWLAKEMQEVLSEGDYHAAANIQKEIERIKNQERDENTK